MIFGGMNDLELQFYGKLQLNEQSGKYVCAVYGASHTLLLFSGVSIERAKNPWIANDSCMAIIDFQCQMSLIEFQVSECSLV